MSQHHDDWTLLAERGEWRGADEVAARALDQIHQSNNGQPGSIGTPEPTEWPAATHPPVDRRRFPGALVASAAFLVAGAVVAIPLLIAGLGDDQVPAGDTDATSDSVVAATIAGQVQSDASTPVDPGIELVPMSEWPTPAVGPVLGLPQCEGGEAAISKSAPGWYTFLGREPASASLRLVDLASVAATTPVPRAGTSSLLTAAALEGSCTVAAVDGDLIVWSLLGADRTAVMSAASVPMDDNGVPDEVGATPGDYQQWRIATGQTFTGPVDAEGVFHVVSSHRSRDGDRLAKSSRILVGEFDPDLVPSGYAYAGLLMNSLAMSILDAVYSPPDPDVARYALPTGLPAGYGLCAAMPTFVLNGPLDGPAEEREQAILCDAAGHEIIFTSPYPPVAPDGATETVINGHTAHEWSTDDTISIRLERPETQNELAFILEASADIGPAMLRAVAGSTPIASPPPDQPDAAVALIGVGDGISTDVAELHIPSLDDEDAMLTTTDRIAAGAYIDPAEMSVSMRTIQKVGFAAYETQPIHYQFNRRNGDYDHESATFDIPELAATVSVDQQYLPTDDRPVSPLGPTETTSGTWFISTDTREAHESIQIIAYSPSIQRSVNVVFNPRILDADGYPNPIGIDPDGALAVVRDILDAIARPE